MTSAQTPSSVEPGVSLYVHVPFCRTKCAYCDFVSVADASPGTIRSFADAVPAALEAAEGPAPLLRDVVTMYVGGGTPSLLGTDAARLVAECSRRVGLRPGSEVTVELNPESTTASIVESLVAAGTNRFSLGVQSFDDGVLATLGRCHTAEEAREAAHILHAAGAPFSVDLICGVPGQTDGAWLRTVLAAIESGAEHASVYPLSVEDGTPLARSIAEGTCPVPSPDQAAEHMIAAEELLEAAGLMRYEVANYAREGAESQHNLGYWTGREFVGVGPGAASMLDVGHLRESAPMWAKRVLPPHAKAGRARFVGAASVEGFGSDPWGTACASVELLDAHDEALEGVMLGMRLTAGVPVDAVRAAGAGEALETCAEAGLVERGEDNRWRLTRRGWLLGNEVFRRIWTGV